MLLDPRLPASSLLHKLTAIDPHLVFIRPRIIEGKTASGIVYARPRAPRVFATVIGIPSNNPLAESGDLLPGDLVMFARYAEQVVGFDQTILDYKDPDWRAYSLEIATVHNSAIECVLPYKERLEV